MGGGWSDAVQVVGTPTGQAAKLQEHLDAHFLRRLFETFFGGFAMHTSSWTNLAKQARNDRDKLINVTQMLLEGDGLLETDVSSVELFVLSGRHGPERQQQGGLMWWFDAEPQVTFNLNHDATVTMQKSFNVDEHIHRGAVRPNRVLSNEDLGLSSQVEELQASLARQSENGDALLLRVSQTYVNTHYSPPHGNVIWTSELILAGFVFTGRAFVAIQVDVQDRGEHSATVSLYSIAGEVVLSWRRSELEELSSVDIEQQLASACECGVRKLELVFPNGSSCALINESHRRSLRSLLLKCLEQDEEVSAAQPNAPSTDETG
eukprot:TRINITY_DN25853_c0_g1_i1.p1 TRINITY_DN25853_c0_g1~~TRINITY_DN25853_c0_g1_i1.p1  ORF type:complete len:320 (-),score=64.16 TRINITY_DN25853_c0_g1_i1:113-1072(-)